MSDIDDLIARLRFDAEHFEDSGFITDNLTGSDFREAADAIIRLRDVVAFYAKECNWKPISLYACGHQAGSNVECDRGNKARAALATTKIEKDEEKRARDLGTVLDSLWKGVK